MRSYLGALALGLVGLTSASHAQTADVIFGERAYALALDARCGLFSEAERDALDAARLQARGVLLRSGVSAGRVARYAGQLAEDAETQACDAAETQALRARVADAFGAYLTMRRMEFPGEHFNWSADRLTYGADAGWVLVQDAGPVRTGLSVINGGVAYSVSAPPEAVFASAVLVFRDPARETGLYDVTADGLLPPPAGADWVRWAPPEDARRLVWANSRLDGDTVSGLYADETPRTLFRFPDQAIHALAALDPRETARVDYLDRNGNRVHSVFIEVGDFSAALAFLRAALKAETDS